MSNRSDPSLLSNLGNNAGVLSTVIFSYGGLLATVEAKKTFIYRKKNIIQSRIIRV